MTYSKNENILGYILNPMGTGHAQCVEVRLFA